MHPVLKTILYGLGVFVIFTTIAIILKLVSNQAPEKDAYFGLFTKSDLMLGLVVAFFVTLRYEQKKKLK